MAIALAVELILLDTLMQRVLNTEEGKCGLEAPNVNSRNWAEYHLCHPRQFFHILMVFVLCSPLNCLYCETYVVENYI